MSVCICMHAHAHTHMHLYVLFCVMNICVDGECVCVSPDLCFSFICGKLRYHIISLCSCVYFVMCI